MGLRVIGPPADGVKRGLPGGAADTTDSYTDKLVKLVPAEAIAAYPTVHVLAQQGGSNKDLLVMIGAWVMLLIVVVLRWKSTSAPGKGAQWGAVFIAAVAFFIWVHVMRGSFGLDLLMAKIMPAAGGGAAATRDAAAAAQSLSAQDFVSNLALTTWTLLAPAVYKGDQDS